MRPSVVEMYWYAATLTANRKVDGHIVNFGNGRTKSANVRRAQQRFAKPHAHRAQTLAAVV